MRGRELGASRWPPVRGLGVVAVLGLVVARELGQIPEVVCEERREAESSRHRTDRDDEVGGWQRDSGEGGA